MSISSLLDKLAVVERKDPVTGGQAATWTARLSDIPCSLQPGLKIGNQGTPLPSDLLKPYEVHFDQDVQLTRQDRLLVDEDYYYVNRYVVVENLAIVSQTLYTAYVTLMAPVTEVADVETQVRTTSATGGVSLDWAVTSAGIPCRAEVIVPTTAMMMYDRLGYKATVRFYFPQDLALTVSDRIVHRGVRYDVRHVDNHEFMDQVWVVWGEKKPL